MYLYGANDPQAIVGEVANLRQKYEECRQEVNSLSSSDSAAKIKGYQKRIGVLESQIKQHENELLQIKKQNTEMTRDLSQKQGVIRSLEKSLTTKDQQYRQSVTQNESLAKEANTVKVGKIERESLKNALLKAKADLEKLEKSMGKNDKDVVALRSALASAKAEIEKLRKTAAQGQSTTNTVSTNQNSRVFALENELSHANAMIIQLQKKVAQPAAVQEKIVTKVVEPTEKLAALQRELANAQSTIASLKKGSSAKVVVQEKIVEKVVYKDRPVIQEKIVEKVVYKDRPAVVEKVAAKSAKQTEQLNKALHQKLAQNEVQSTKLKAPALSKPTSTITTKTAVKNATVTEKVQKTSPITKAPEPVASSLKKSAPSAYRMATDAPVYSAPGGSVVETWEARRSFTSGTASNGWVKITGYFVNRVWQRADRDLWVKESDVIKR